MAVFFTENKVQDLFYKHDDNYPLFKQFFQNEQGMILAKFW